MVDFTTHMGLASRDPGSDIRIGIIARPRDPDPASREGWEGENRVRIPKTSTSKTSTFEIGPRLA